jgi:hypothetical protein
MSRLKCCLPTPSRQAISTIEPPRLLTRSSNPQFFFAHLYAQQYLIGFAGRSAIAELYQPRLGVNPTS